MPTIDRPETLTSAVVKQLSEAIVRGELSPGLPLPEIGLSRDLGVSRGTVREALRLLTDDGLVEIFPHRGAFVTHLSHEGLDDTFDVRGLLEPHAIRLAAERGRLGENARVLIRAMLDDLRLAADQGDTAAFIKADQRFHESLSAVCGNELLVGILGSIRTQVRRYMIWGRILDHSNLHIELAQHEQLAAVLQRGTTDEIEIAAREHISRARGIAAARLIAVETASRAGDLEART